MKRFSGVLLTGLVILFIGCKPDKPTTPTNNEPEMPNVSSIGDSNKIEIVTWNIKRFPQTNYSDEYVKSIIEGLRADIYVLQEIQSKSKFAAMMGEIDDYNYLLQPSSSSLNFALVYRRGVVSVLNSAELFIQDDKFFAGRPPLLTKVEWQKNGITKDLTIINIHLKCCGDDSIEIGNSDDEEYRRVVAGQLLHNYVSDSLNDENVIIAGDWNDAIQEPVSTNTFQIFIDDSTDFKFVDMDIALGDAANWSWQGWSSSWPAIHFDHILINNNLYNEFDNFSVVDVIKLEEDFNNGISEYDGNVSDHRPVYFKFVP